MVNNNQTIDVKLSQESIRRIESFVDAVCDQLFINDTYYGNILVSVTELFNYLLKHDQNKSISITYYSDYKTVSMSFQPIDNQSVVRLGEKINIDDLEVKHDYTSIFLIKSLVEKMSVVDDTVILDFDISALHNDIYNRRNTLLKEYFAKQAVPEKVVFRND